MNEPGRSTITKRDLVQRIADHTGQTKVLVRDILQQFLDEVAEELSQGNRLEFRKFGVFEVRKRPGRMAQNPKTLEKVEVPPKWVVKFKVGNVLKKRVEGGPSAPPPADPSTAVPFSLADTPAPEPTEATEPTDAPTDAPTEATEPPSADPAPSPWSSPAPETSEPASSPDEGEDSGDSENRPAPGGSPFQD